MKKKQKKTTHLPKKKKKKKGERSVPMTTTVSKTELHISNCLCKVIFTYIYIKLFNIYFSGWSVN